MSLDEDDIILFDEDDTAAPASASAVDAEKIHTPWRVLIVDDDEQVHAATKFALSKSKILGRPIEFLSAHSAIEGFRAVEANRDLAVILLDVVMETDSAGLDLVKRIREELDCPEVRIVLRTGQPGYAPELDVIETYDINDYRTKQELTHSRLITALTTALRSYEQIRTNIDTRKGLERVVHATTDLLSRSHLADFADGVLAHAGSLIERKVDGLVCVRPDFAQGATDATIIAGASGRFAEQAGCPLDTLGSPDAAALVSRAFDSRRHVGIDKASVYHLGCPDESAVVYLETPVLPSPVHRQLLDVFATNVAVGYRNVQLLQRLSTAAYADPVTGFGNRVKYIEELDLHRNGEEGRTTAVMLDICRFADINNSLGHNVGDHVLRAVAIRLSEGLGGAVITRVGPDQFGLLGTADELDQGKIRALFNAPLIVGDHQFQITVALGYYTMVPAPRSGLAAFKRVSIALDQARLRPHDRLAHYEPAMQAVIRQRLENIKAMRQGLNGKKFEVWYQPQIDLSTGKTVSLEALARWPNGPAGATSPAVFIPLAEQSGLIVDLGSHILDQSLRDLKILHSKGYKEISVAVNVSLTQFRSPGFYDQVIAALRHHDIDPSLLELEITESVMMADANMVVDCLNRLRSFGIGIALDDFGTGYSSLSYLQKLPIDVLKIDRSFISKATENTSTAFAEAIQTIGRRRGLLTLAEGVETERELEWVRSLGCDRVQGYHYSKPLRFDDLLAWLAERQ